MLEDGFQIKETAKLTILFEKCKPEDLQPSESSVKVYPNPTTEFVNVDFKTLENAPVSIKLYDVYGKDMGELYNSSSNVNKKSVQLKLKNYTKGINVLVIEMVTIKKPFNL